MSDKVAALKVLRDQARTLNIEVDNRWSAEVLAQKVLDAQEAKQQAAKDEFKSAKKVLVRLKFDAFPEADVKVLKGETCEVTLDIAKKWIADGVAERADPFPGE